MVRRDLVEMGYAVGAVPIEAASAGGFQLRDRYWLVADAAEQNDGSAINPQGAGQEPEFRSGVFKGHDCRRQGRLAGWVIPDAGISPLAHEIPNRLGQYRAIGNAIDPFVAAEVIGAYMEIAA
jgi:DNA (cytosine-5)-methyltransferase 1